jgi:hypothetical protein
MDPDQAYGQEITIQKKTLKTKDSWISETVRNADFTFYSFNRGYTYAGSIQPGLFDMFAIYIKR